MARMFFCNKCGRQLCKNDELNGFHYSGRFKYGSKFDGEEFDIDLCTDCIDEFMDSCSLNPVTMLPKEMEERYER